MAALTIISAAAVAWANGANDVSKGVATLVGSRLATYARALRWGALWTVAGSAGALLWTTTLLKTFSTGLVAGSVGHATAFPLAVAIGACLWVLIASRTGLPVSTTHAVTGAIVGTALAAGGAEGVRWALIVKTVAVPLAFSPLVAGVVAYGLHAAIGASLATASRYCICARERGLLVPDSPVSAAAAARPITLPVMIPVIIVDETRVCRDSETETLTGGMRLTDAAHWLTSAALSFARGLNDTPKIVALAIAAVAATGLGTPALYLVGPMVMGAGSILSGRRVTRTLGERVTEMDPLEGLAASVVAAGLVLAASIIALPVSTTHVASGAIVGVGLRSGSRAVRWSTVRSMVVAWLVTLPVAAAGAAIAWIIIVI